MKDHCWASFWQFAVSFHGGMAPLTQWATFTCTFWLERWVLHQHLLSGWGRSHSWKNEAQIYSLEIAEGVFYECYSERASAAARSAASASEHSCNVRVCTYVDTMYTFNLYMYQKSFEVPTMWSHARKRKYYLVHPVTQAQVSEVWREVWEMNITFCFQGIFCRQILLYFEHCFDT